MGFWNKLGKIALSAAPYVAAPFTGGASLLFAPAANKAVSTWSQHDANVAASKGLAPSSFDKYLGIIDNAASIAGGVGAFSGLGDSFSGGNFTGAGTGDGGGPSNFQKILGGVTTGIGVANTIKSMKGQGGETVPSATTSPSQGGNTSSTSQSGSNTGIGPTNPSSMINPTDPFSGNQNNPNLANALAAGRQAGTNSLFGRKRYFPLQQPQMAS